MQGNSFIGTLILTTFVVSFSWTAAQPKSDWTVGILVYDGVYNTEFVAPMDVFDHVTAQRTATVRVILVAPRAKSVRSVEKLNFQADYSFEDHPPIDILVVPSFQNYQDDLERRDEIIAWVHKTASSARFVLSNCWGAFYLAKAGLLDGRMAMTYPPDIDKLGQQFPKVKAVKGHRFVRRWQVRDRRRRSGQLRQLSLCRRTAVGSGNRSDNRSRAGQELGSGPSPASDCPLVRTLIFPHQRPPRAHPHPGAAKPPTIRNDPVRNRAKKISPE